MLLIHLNKLYTTRAIFTLVNILLFLLELTIFSFASLIKVGFALSEAHTDSYPGIYGMSVEMLTKAKCGKNETK